MIIENGSTSRIPILMVDSTDDETAETGLTVTCQISKNGGSFATTTNSVVEVSNGWYYVVLTATETNTNGPLLVRATASGADEWRDYHQVATSLPAALSATEQNSLADAILKRDWTSVSGEASRSVLNALRFLRNRFAIVSSTLTVYEEDDTTPAWQSTISTAAGDPVSESDPT